MKTTQSPSHSQRHSTPKSISGQMTNSWCHRGHSLSRSAPGEVHGFCRIAVILWNSKSYGLKVNLIHHQSKCYIYIEKPRQNNNTEAVNGITHFPMKKHSSPSVLKSKNTWGGALICNHGRVFIIINVKPLYWGMKVWLTYKKLYIFNVYNLMSMEISIHP